MSADLSVLEAATALPVILADAAHVIEEALSALLGQPTEAEARLIEAMRYASLNGGKRMRGFLVLQVSSLFDVPTAQAARVAASVEMLHAYSLVHDDLPAMDDDDLRRGKPTVHKAFDEATAILAGDSLHAAAFEWLADPATHPDPFVRAELVLEVARAAGPGGMAGGQAMDLEAEKTTFDLATITRLQALKTGALIAVSVEAGAILGRVQSEGRTALRGYARDIGLAFQIADDLLDVEGDEATVGKALRKDEGAGKETFVSLLGVERAKEQAAMLVDQAVDHLRGYGAEADLLRDVARFILERDR